MVQELLFFSFSSLLDFYVSTLTSRNAIANFLVLLLIVSGVAEQNENIGSSHIGPLPLFYCQELEEIRDSAEIIVSAQYP